MFEKISEITIAKGRQRKAFDPDLMQELIDSIQKQGLLHPIAFRTESGKKILVAGERRLRAVQEINELFGESVTFNGCEVPVGQIPATCLGELDELAAEEAEWEENKARTDLSWQEQAEATERLHNLRAKQKQRQAELLRKEASSAMTTAQPQKAVQTYADTAVEVYGRSDGGYQTKIREQVILAQNMHRPEVAKAKTQKEAAKVLQKVLEKERNQNLAKTLASVQESVLHRIHNGDCLTILEDHARSGELFDVICSDPPYGMNAHKFGDAAGKLTGTSHDYDDSREAWVSLMGQFVHKIFAATKPQAHAYLFCDFDNFHALKNLMTEAGWYVFRTPLVYDKKGSGRVPLPDQGPRRTYELILYAIKGKKQTINIFNDVISVEFRGENIHGANKPSELYQNLLMRSVRPGDLVFDGFAGSGPILQAAQNLQCRAVAVELSPASYALLSKELERVVNGSKGILEI